MEMEGGGVVCMPHKISHYLKILWDEIDRAQHLVKVKAVWKVLLD